MIIDSGVKRYEPADLKMKAGAAKRAGTNGSHEKKYSTYLYNYSKK
jgi:hypothetical protein